MLGAYLSRCHRKDEGHRRNQSLSKEDEHRFEFGCVMRVRISDQSPIRSGPHLILAIYGPGQQLPPFSSCLDEPKEPKPQTGQGNNGSLIHINRVKANHESLKPFAVSQRVIVAMLYAA